MVTNCNNAFKAQIMSSVKMILEKEKLRQLSTPQKQQTTNDDGAS